MNLMSGDDEYDLHHILAKSLYFALLVNVLLPAALLYMCHYAANNYFPENRIGELANSLFYLFAVVAVAQGALAWWWRSKLFAQPMILSMESFEKDMTVGLLRASRPVSLLVASISGWGYVYFLLTGRFRETAVLVLFSFVMYQVVRPRLGSLQKLVTRQKQMAEKGQLLGR